MSLYNITATGEDGIDEQEVVEALMPIGMFDITMIEDDEE